MLTMILAMRMVVNNVAQNNIARQIFIGGCSRSGTTLLGAMLGTHSRSICSPESHFKIELLRPLRGKTDEIALTAVANRMIKHWRFTLWDVSLDTALIDQEADGNSYADLLNWLISQYAANEKKSEADIWVDHTPENVSYADSLISLFPDAKFIHIVRDGRAVAASAIPLDWGPNTIIKAARWWLRMVSFGLAAETLLPSNQIFRIRYEDLITNTDACLQEICHFLEIEYEPEMVQATGFRPPLYTTSQHKSVGQYPNRRSLDRWKTTLSAREIELFEHQTRNFLTYLGYPMKYALTAKGPSFRELQFSKVKELFVGEILNKFKWLIRSYPLWLKRDFYAFARLSDSNN